MAQTQGQDKIGYPTDTTGNVTDRSRPLPDGQPKIGYSSDSTPNDSRGGGSPLDPAVQPGYAQAVDNPQPPEPRRVDDKIGPVDQVEGANP